MKNMLIKVSVAACLCLIAAQTASAKITLPDIFSDNMVLQQQAEARLWGWSEPKKEVSVTTSWNGETYKTTSDGNGKWTLSVATPAASYEQQTVTVADKDGSVTLSNVLIGEVWFCSGQSNMEMPLAGFDN